MGGWEDDDTGQYIRLLDNLRHNIQEALEIWDVQILREMTNQFQGSRHQTSVDKQKVHGMRDSCSP